MQVHIERTHFLSVLKRAGAAVVPGSDQIYKACVLLAAEDRVMGTGNTGGILLRSNADTLHIKCEVTGDVRRAGRALLGHKRLFSIVSELPAGIIELTVNDKLQVKIKSLSSKRHFTMQSHDPESFPPLLAQEAGETLFGIEAKIFQQAAEETTFLVDKSYVDGVLLSPVDDKRFGLIGMSGRGLAVATAWFTKSTSRKELVIPRALLDAVSVLPGDQTELLVQATDRHVTVSCPGTTISCDQLQSSFPSVWESILAAAPKEKRFRMSSTALLESVRAVSVAAEVEGEERFVQIDLSYRNSECLVSTRKSATNFGEDELVVTDPSPGECVIHMDGQRLSQALRAFEPAEIDVYYDVIYNQEALLLKNENLSIALTPISDIKAKGG
jgi:DNA polymerase III sliding clamp (beta) subunit (PCNA family)